MSDGPERVDTIVDGWYVVTMNPSRDIIHYGSVALRDGVVVAVEPTTEIDARYRADRRLGGAALRRHSGPRQHAHPHHR